MKKNRSDAAVASGSPKGFRDFLKTCYSNVRFGWHWFLKTFF